MPSEFRNRLARIKYEWPQAVTLVAEIFMALVGADFLVNAVHPTIKPDSPWHRWGTGGLLVFGVAFLAVGLYGAFYRERVSGLIPTFLLVGIALPAEVRHRETLGAILYALFLVGGLAEAHTRRERAALRKQWTVTVPRDGGG